MDFYEQLSTEKLDEMLNKELHSESVDSDVVRKILDVLWERENTPAVITPAIQEAWELYQQQTKSK